MQMWIDLVLDEDLGLGAQVILEEPLVEVGMDSALEEPYPTIYVFLPVFGTSKFGEARSEFISPMFYHIGIDLERIDLVTGHRYCNHANISMTVVVEACD